MTPKETPSKNSSDKAKGTYAIVESSGQQFWLEPNRYYDLDRIKADVNQIISIEKVLLLNNEEGTVVGRPYVKDAFVQLKVIEHRRGKKLIVYKMRPKKKTRRKNGHRQELTRVMVESISIGSQAKPSKKSTSKKSTKAETNDKKEPATSKVSKSTKEAPSTS